MKCAVLLPLYNGDSADWLRECIESILSQTIGFNRIHIYLGIDGQIDKMLQDVVDDYSSRIHKIICNSENTGLAENLNRLILQLDDEQWVFRVDADDICDDRRFEVQIEYLESHPELGIVGTGLMEIDQNGAFLRNRTWVESPTLVRKRLYKMTAMAHPTVCFRRTILQLLGGYNGKLRLSQDLDLWFRAAQMGIQMGNIPQVLYKLRLADNLFRRRSRQKAWVEFCLYWNGCVKLYGYSWRHLFPILRLCSRLLPTTLVKHLYSGPWRQLISGA